MHSKGTGYRASNGHGVYYGPEFAKLAQVRFTRSGTDGKGPLEIADPDASQSVTMPLVIGAALVVAAIVAGVFMVLVSLKG
jgi:hypothetical protein